MFSQSFQLLSNLTMAPVSYGEKLRDKINLKLTFYFKTTFLKMYEAGRV